ncbi:MAG: hypothetical protein ACFE91_02510 [Promethearchaeota archaeon]
MPEDNEKVEDFISLWRKKMEVEKDRSSAIGETLERIKEVEKENEELRNKIKMNIDLFSKTEEIVRNTLEENERLKRELKQAGMKGGIKVSEVQQKTIDLTNKVKSLEQNLAEKEKELGLRINEINKLKMKIQTISTPAKPLDKPISETESIVTKELIDNLQSELSKKKKQIDDLESKIKDLTEENKALNEQLLEKMKKLPIDYVVPVETPKSSVIKPQSVKPSSSTLEILCQDLQIDLNKYKKIVDKLNKEKSELEQAIQNGGFKLEPEDIKELKKENEQLKIEISQIQASLQKKSLEAAETIKITEAQKKMNILQEQLKEKDLMIAELKSKEEIQPIALEGPMSGLIEDLQDKINKLKITLEEKNKIIEELQSS